MSTSQRPTPEEQARFMGARLGWQPGGDEEQSVTYAIRQARIRERQDAQMIAELDAAAHRTAKRFKQEIAASDIARKIKDQPGP